MYVVHVNGENKIKIEQIFNNNNNRTLKIKYHRLGIKKKCQNKRHIL